MAPAQGSHTHARTHTHTHTRTRTRTRTHKSRSVNNKLLDVRGLRNARSALAGTARKPWPGA